MAVTSYSETMASAMANVGILMEHRGMNKPELRTPFIQHLLSARPRARYFKSTTSHLQHDMRWYRLYPAHLEGLHMQQRPLEPGQAQSEQKFTGDSSFNLVNSLKW